LFHLIGERRSLRAIVLALAAVCCGVSAADLSGVVTSVNDGDSLTLRSGDHSYRIRLADIDAPELAQPFGKDSRTSLRHMCLLKAATVETAGEDRYGRTIGRVVCINTDANSEQVRRGMAWVFVRFAAKDSPLYSIQQEARNARRGLWVDAEPVAPWDWRRQMNVGERKERPNVAR
jgi:endonuclease YncB( thermonuclease family)